MSRRRKSLHLSSRKRISLSTPILKSGEIVYDYRKWIFMSLVITFMVTFPAFLSPSNTFVGTGSEDSALVSGYMHALKSSGTWIFSNNLVDVVGWPNGVQNASGLALLTSASSLLTFILTWITDSITAQLILVTISMISSILIVTRIISMFTSTSYIKILGVLFICLAPMSFQWNSALPILGMNSFFLLILYLALNEVNSKKWSLLIIIPVSILVSAWHPYFTFFFIMVLSSAAIAFFWVFKKIPKSIYVSSLGCISYCIVAAIYFLENPLGVKWIGEDIGSPSLQGLFQYSLFESNSRAFINPFVIGLAGLGLISIGLKSNKPRSLERVIALFSTLVIIQSILLFGIHSIFGFKGPSFFLNYIINGLRNGQYAMSLVQMAFGLLAVIGLQTLHKSLMNLKLQYLWNCVAFILVSSFVLFLSFPTINGSIDRWMVRPNSIDWNKLRGEISTLEPGPVLIAPFEVEYGTDGVVCQFITDKDHPLVNKCGLANATTAVSLIDKVQTKKGCNKFSFAKQEGVKYIILWSKSQNQVIHKCVVELGAKEIKKFDVQDISVFQI